MARIFVYSTLTCDQNYTNWHPAPEGNPIAEPAYSVLIKGGANVADRYSLTARGIRTEITEQDLEELKKNQSFLRHEQKGFITVREDKVDAEVAVAAGMKQKDDSAPVTPNDYKDHQDFAGMKEKPKVKEKEED